MNSSNRCAWPSLGLCVLLVTGIVLGAGNVFGADDAEPQPAAKDAPSGLRFIFKMNVILIKNFDLIAKAAGIEYQSYGYGMDLDKPLKRGRQVVEDTPRTLMEKGEVDVCLTVDLNWAEWPALDKWAPAGLAHNPNFRLYQQARFLAEKPEERDNSKIADVQAALDKARKKLEVRVDAINKDLGKQVVFIVPVGDAIVKLREMVVDGKFPGVTKQSELFLSGPRGSIHVEKHANLLTAYCNYAAIYQKSPVGLKLEMEDITDEQHAILQKLAWETVSQYPYAGLKQ
jgi:hypothetical protein